MDDAKYLELLAAHRKTHRELSILGYMIVVLFVIDVLGPVMKELGLWNLLGMGQ